MKMLSEMAELSAWFKGLAFTKTPSNSVGGVRRWQSDLGAAF
jgi:hypothetical protein